MLQFFLPRGHSCVRVFVFFGCVTWCCQSRDVSVHTPTHIHIDHLSLFFFFIDLPPSRLCIFKECIAKRLFSKLWMTWKFTDVYILFPFLFFPFLFFLLIHYPIFNTVILHQFFFFVVSLHYVLNSCPVLNNPSDKDLLSQTRTLAMSFVKCASTDTEHQYKLVKDISFWNYDQYILFPVTKHVWHYK